MKIFLVVFLSILLLFLLMAYPLNVSVKAHVNFINPKCFYSIKALFIKLLVGTTYIEDGRLIIQNTHNLIYNTQEDSQKQMIIGAEIIKKIEISKVQIYFSAGIKNNAYQTAMLCGYAYGITSSLLSVLISKNNCIDIFQDIDPQYNKDALDITLKCIIQISTLDVICGIIKGLFKYKEIIRDKAK